jgi:hypothetical protein
MPPQQAYGLLDLVDQRLDFSAHWLSVPSAFSLFSNCGGPYSLVRAM